MFFAKSTRSERVRPSVRKCYFRKHWRFLVPEVYT